ncbi:hypothetical protein [Pseudostreptobacillus hongkongensis]|uniref:hypothetical protein n=1 Tax=Pseudostreptobacillus hongkongensis TaxID=1162717 RepID=UPI00082BFD7B|nr:hypothetical protein [Pseudostreptobacillus hongkongensis]
MIRVLDLTREFIRFFKNNWFKLIIILLANIFINIYVANFIDNSSSTYFWVSSISLIILDILLLNVFMYEYTDNKFNFRRFLEYFAIRIVIVLITLYTGTNHFLALPFSTVLMVFSFILIFFKYLYYSDEISLSNSIDYSFTLFKAVWLQILSIIFIYTFLVVVLTLIMTFAYIDTNTLANINDSILLQQYIRENTMIISKNYLYITLIELLGMIESVLIGVYYYRLKKIKN